MKALVLVSHADGAAEETSLQALALAKTAAVLGLAAPITRLLAKMVAYEPTERFQTPNQLVEGIRLCRAELAGPVVRSRTPTGPKTVFVVGAEGDFHGKYQDNTGHRSACAKAAADK
mgnify:CR=1 FL=1